MIRTTRWHPDTCECIVEYEWDDKESNETRKHNFKGFVSKCKFHQNADIDDYASLLKENKTKNVSMDIIASVLPGITEPINGGVKIKDDEIIWAYNDKRQLEITIVNAGTSSKDAVDIAIKEISGLGEVVVL